MLFDKYPWILFLSLSVLMPLEGCYLFCLFKADPVLEETVEHIIEHEIKGINQTEK